MRVLFCGSGTFAVPVLQAILASDHDVALIVTQPPRPAGRGGNLRETPVAEFAREAGLAAEAWENINAPQAAEHVQRLNPDVICVVDFGQFISRTLCQLPPHGAFNLHGSLLPELRGAAPVNWAIIRGHRRTGVTTFSLVPRMDAGPIYMREELQIDPHETAEELRGRLAALGAKVVCSTLGMLSAGWAQAQEQDESQATYAPLLTKAAGRVDFTAPAEAIRNLIHGIWPWPGGQAIFRKAGKDVPVILARAGVAEGAAAGEPGTLDEQLLVATGSGRLAIEQIKPAGKRLMEWRDFVNGYRVAPGDRLVRVEDEHG